MLHFRPVCGTGHAPFELLDVGQMIDEVLQPGQFFVAPPLHLAWDLARTEEMCWEVFRGNLLDAAQTRERRSFLGWHLRDAALSGSVLSVKLDIPQRLIHVTRGFLCRHWVGYDSGGGVILSREEERWQQELVGTIPLAQFTDLETLRDELVCVVWQACVGTSRLPLTSIEAPLPAYILGRLAYVYRPGTGGDAPMSSVGQLLDAGLQPGLAWREYVKLLETALRASCPAEAQELAQRFLQRWRVFGRSDADILKLLRSLFNDVSLSPYLSLVDTTFAWSEALRGLGALSVADHVDFLSSLLRQLGRHLTAYDLEIFHHRGANYPDALLLDAALKRYLTLSEDAPALFAGETAHARRRRRALRQGVAVRHRYAGHLVPTVPTSPGENARVLPGYPHLTEEEVLQPLRRPRRLFEDEPLGSILTPHTRALVAESLLDLAHPAERAELGTAVFIDRPLGYAKLPGEPDQTPLLAHEAYSPRLAQRRLHELAQLATELGIAAPPAAEAPRVAGLPHTILATPARPTAALADVRRVADDFVIVRTLSGGLADLWSAFDFESLCGTTRPRLAVQVGTGGGATLTFHDGDLRPYLEVVPDLSKGYARRAGLEFPAAGLKVLAQWRDGRRVESDDLNVAVLEPVP
jgi:hypothetical protein